MLTRVVQVSEVVRHRELIVPLALALRLAVDVAALGVIKIILILTDVIVCLCELHAPRGRSIANLGTLKPLAHQFKIFYHFIAVAVCSICMSCWLEGTLILH